MRTSYVVGSGLAVVALGIGGGVAAATRAPQPPIDPAKIGVPKPAQPTSTSRASMATSVTAPSAGVGGATQARPPRPTTAQLETARDVLSPNFAILRRAATNADPSAFARRATASDGHVLTVALDEHGLCITSSRGTACGNPKLAASGTATVLHSVSPEGELLAGVVPDDVATVRIQTTTGSTVDVPARDNVFEASLSAPQQSAAVLWVMRDGSVEEKVK